MGARWGTVRGRDNAGTRTGRGCVGGWDCRSVLPRLAHRRLALSPRHTRGPAATTSGHDDASADGRDHTDTDRGPSNGGEAITGSAVGDAPAFGDEAIANPFVGSSATSGRVPWQRFAEVVPGSVEVRW